MQRRTLHACTLALLMIGCGGSGQTAGDLGAGDQDAAPTPVDIQDTSDPGARRVNLRVYLPRPCGISCLWNRHFANTSV